MGKGLVLVAAGLIGLGDQPVDVTRARSIRQRRAGLQRTEFWSISMSIEPNSTKAVLPRGRIQEYCKCIQTPARIEALRSLNL